MPLYEYECEACGHRFEKIQRFSDQPIEVCPNCGEPKVRKLLSSPAIQFKGSGWYITDYARKGATGTDAGQAAPKDAKSPASDSSTTPTSSGSTSSNSTTTATTTPSTKDS